MSDFNTNDTLIDLFLFETSQLLEQLEQVILSTDSNNYYSEEDINEVFRIMHTIKGSSAMMSYRSIFDISHAVEDLFSYIRNNNPKQDYCSSLNDLILNCIDFIKIELEKISGRKNVDGDSAELVERIKAFSMI
ncbi:MAG TPA: Hpt domain-containing protein [Tissierellaceae bacterium]